MKLNSFMETSLAKWVFKNVNELTKYKDQHNADFLRFSNAFNFAVLCIAQAGSFAFNSDIPKDVKKFLVPQELVEGGLKAVVFTAVAAAFTKLGHGLVDNAYILPKNIINNNKLKLKGKSRTQAKEIINDLSIDLNKSNHLKKALFTEEAITFKNFRGSVGIISNMVGMIVGLSVVLPPVRNYIAGQFKTAQMEKEQKTLDVTSYAKASVNKNFNDISKASSYTFLNTNLVKNNSLFKL